MLPTRHKRRSWIAYSSEEQRRQTTEQRKVHGDQVAMMQSGHAAEVDQMRNDLAEELAAD